MSIAGDHPEGGIRFDLMRVTTEPPWVYDGAAFTPEREHPVRASIDLEGEVRIDREAEMPIEVVKRVRLLLRNAYKHGSGQGAAPPRRLRRWRAE